jgi:hypothetical protein
MGLVAVAELARDLCMCRLSESTTLMTRSGATWRAIRHVPGPRPVRRLDRRPPPAARQLDRRAYPIGDEGVVAPAGEQLGLGADQAGAAHDTARLSP